MNTELISQLQSGSIILLNDSNLDDLRAVLTYAFPEDRSPLTGCATAYTSIYSFHDKTEYWIPVGREQTKSTRAKKSIL